MSTKSLFIEIETSFVLVMVIRCATNKFQKVIPARTARGEHFEAEIFQLRDFPATCGDSRTNSESLSPKTCSLRIKNSFAFIFKLDSIRALGYGNP